jgi:ABC-2 type transport system permease protein
MTLRHHCTVFATILTKEVRRFLRIWPQTLLPPAITMVLYFVIFGAVIGARVGTMGGFNYMDYVVPGLVMMSVITNAYSNVASSFFSNKFQKSVEELLVAPIDHHILLLGFVMGGALRGVLTGLIVVTLSMGFTRLQIHSIGITLLAVIMTAMLFALGGFINAVFAGKFDDISIIPTFVLTPLTYLGGVFYSVTVLPDFWQGISQLNPILYMVNAFRYGMLGFSDGIDVTAALLVILGLLLCLYAFSYYLLHTGRGLRQ